MTELQALLEDLSNARVWVEIGALAGCMALAWLVSWMIGRGQPKDSVWFGRNTLDGLFFPLVALALIYAARVAVSHYQPVAVLRVAVPVFLSLAAIRLAVLVLTAVFPSSGGIRLLERFVSWIAWLAAILWILGLLPSVLAELDQITLAFGKTKVSVRTIIEGTLSSGLVLVLVLWVSATIERRLLYTHVSDLSVRKIASNAMRSVLLLVGFLFALSAVGVDLTALSVLGGAIGVGLGFGLQKLASNYVSGFVILLERSLRIGDNVRIDGFEGKITDIKTRYTLVRGSNGRESIVPNELLITQRVENLSLSDAKILVSSTISVGYDSDVRKVREILCACAAASNRVLKDPGPVAHLANFGADGLEFSLLFWIMDPENGQLNVRSEINMAVLSALRAADIDIPYPQRVVHVRPDGTLATPAGAAAQAAPD
ncbi:MAG TPA: mechanosensitive ion channel domain-containing protein [Burkholderiaceae bacterium]